MLPRPHLSPVITSCRQGRPGRLPPRQSAWLLTLLALLSIQFFACQRRADDAVIVSIDPHQRFQVFEGFGTSIIGWQPVMRAFYERDEFRQLYLNELGASALRVDLNGESVPETPDWQDLSCDDFLLEGPGARGAAYLHVAETLTRASAGKLRVIASVWSPPAWMKVNGLVGNGSSPRKGYALSLSELGLEGEATPQEASDERRRYVLGNKLRPDRYVHFAKSLVEWTRLYHRHGVELYGLSPQNEPRFSQWYESAVYTPAELARLTATLIEVFQSEGVPLPRLFAPETMSRDTEVNRAYLDALLQTRSPARLHAVAAHGYVDGVLADSDPRSSGLLLELAAPRSLHVWLTEGGTGGDLWPAPLHELGASLMNALVGAQASMITPWQVAGTKLDQNVLTSVDGPSKKLRVASHFFRHIRPGMQRIAAKSSDDDVDVVAFAAGAVSETHSTARPREVVLVVMNRSKGGKRLVPYTDHGSAFDIRSMQVTSASLDRQQEASAFLPGESIATLVLRDPRAFPTN